MAKKSKPRLPTPPRPLRVHQEFRAPAGAISAESIPFINALYVRGYSPQDGDDMPTAMLPPSRQRQLRHWAQWEWYDHELTHLRLGQAIVPDFVRSLSEGIYSLLLSLSDSLHLYMPSWRITSDENFTGIISKSHQLLQTLSDNAATIEEGICTLFTILNLRTLHAEGVLTNARYQYLMQANHAKSPAEVQSICETFLKYRWFNDARPDHFDILRELVMWIGLTALSPSQDAIRDAWTTGMPDDDTMPRVRFSRLMSEIEQLNNQHLFAARPAIWDIIGRHISLRIPAQDMQVFQSCGRLVMAHSPEWEELLGSEEYAFPDPAEEIRSALSTDSSDERAVKRAFALLHGEYREHEPIEHNSGVSVTSVGMYAPLLTKRGNREDYTCEYMVYIHVYSNGLIRHDGLNGDQVEHTLRPSRMQQLAGRQHPVVSAPDEIKLLWNVARVHEQLLRYGQLSCLCGPSCDPAAGCPCATILARVYRYIRTDDGGYLPDVPCLSGL